MPVFDSKKKKEPPKDGPGTGGAGQGVVKVRAGAFPGGQIADYVLPDGADIGDVLEEAKIGHLKGADIRYNGKPVKDLKTKVKTGDQILAYGKVRGN